jgi:hypothetical protein
VNPTDAAKLLAYASAFDNRRPSEAAAQAWADALPDIPADHDARAAVARYYATPPKNPDERLWIQPHDVRTHRRAIRSERAQHFVYQPPAVESDPRYLTNYRRQLNAVASGHAPAPQALPMRGGPHPAITDALAGIGREVPEEIAAVKRPGPLGVECPTCAAPIGRPCRMPGATLTTGLGKERPTPHRARFRVVDPSRVERPEDPAEIERRRAAARAALQRLPEGVVIEPNDGFRDRS